MYSVLEGMSAAGALNHAGLTSTEMTANRARFSGEVAWLVYESGLENFRGASTLAYHPSDMRSRHETSGFV